MYLFVDELKKFLEIFVTRMKSDSVRGRTITNDTAVQSLFLQLQQMHPKLQAFTKFQEDARGD
jgi:growth factor-regulated tyrosine kinase substrate